MCYKYYNKIYSTHHLYVYTMKNVIPLCARLYILFKHQNKYHIKLLINFKIRYVRSELRVCILLKYGSFLLYNTLLTYKYIRIPHEFCLTSNGIYNNIYNISVIPLNVMWLPVAYVLKYWKFGLLSIYRKKIDLKKLRVIRKNASWMFAKRKCVYLILWFKNNSAKMPAV